MKKLIASAAIAFAAIALPAVVSAQQPNTQVIQRGNTQIIASSSNPDCGSTLCNPIGGVDSVGDLIFKVINFVYSLSYAVIAVFLMISGFKFVMAQGSESGITDAKNTFKYTIIGAILLIGANVITQVIKNLIDSFR